MELSENGSDLFQYNAEQLSEQHLHKMTTADSKSDQHYRTCALLWKKNPKSKLKSQLRSRLRILKWKLLLSVQGNWSCKYPTQTI